MGTRKPREWTYVGMKGERDLPEDPEFLKAVAELTAAFKSKQQKQIGEQKGREGWVRAQLASLGYRLMSRGRKGQFWVMRSTPQTLDEIEGWLSEEYAMCTFEDRE
jgi:hypothetical protein